MTPQLMAPPASKLSREFSESFRGFTCACGFRWAGALSATWPCEPCPQCGEQTESKMFWIRSANDVSPEEAAARVGRTVNELHRLVDEGYIGCYAPIGKSRRWRRFNVGEIRKQLEIPLIN